MPVDPAKSAPRIRPLAAKLVVSGGFGAGKTTFVSSVSEVEPVYTEAAMPIVSRGIDDTTGLPSKTTTTVAMDFGKLTLDDDLVLYLFGTPGQDRFWFMWDDISAGALAAVVLVDTRRLEACYPAVNYFERRGVPFLIAVNQFEGAPVHSRDEVRDALAVGDDVVLVSCDARNADSVRGILVDLCEYILRSYQPRIRSSVLTRSLAAGE